MKKRQRILFMICALFFLIVGVLFKIYNDPTFIGMFFISIGCLMCFMAIL